MDGRLVEAIRSIFDRGLRTKEQTTLIAESRAQVAITQTNQIPYYLNFTQLIQGIPDIIILESTQDATLEYRMQGDAVYRRFPFGLFAGLELVIDSEGWQEIRLTPVALTCIIDYYVARTPTNAEMEGDQSIIKRLKAAVGG